MKVLGDLYWRCSFKLTTSERFEEKVISPFESVSWVFCNHVWRENSKLLDIKDASKGEMGDLDLILNKLVDQVTHMQKVVTTPEPRAMLELPTHTPEPLPHPCKKLQLMAAKRMEGKIVDLKDKASKESPNDGTAEDVGHDKKPKQKPAKKEKAGKKAEEKAEKKSSKKPRKGPENGPVFLAYQKFLKEKKAAGCSHMIAVDLWKKSSERASIVDTLSEAERAKRRYWV